MSAARTATALTPVLVELRTALAAGVSPALALEEACARQPGLLPSLESAARAVALGAPLDAVAGRLPQDAGPAGLLLRALAVADRAGAGAAAAVEQAEAAVAEELELARALRVRTARARGSLRVLTVAPPAVVVFFVLLQPEAIGFYATPVGRFSAVVVAGLVLAARRWAARIVGSVPAAAAGADPLGQSVGGGAAEVAELLAVALRGGLPPGGAVRLVAEVGPPAARDALAAAARGLVAGLPVDAAFAATPLAPMGRLLAVPVRWGARAEEVLCAYAAALRADRRAALAEAAEQAELRLVFPTTLLTLPSFLLGVVPPLVWTALGR